MGKKKPTANTSEENTQSDPNSNGSANTPEAIETEEEKKARKEREEAEKAKRKEARAAQAEAQITVARSLKSLDALVTAHLTAGNPFFGEKDGSESNRDAVFEIINAGDRALEIGFPKLDKPTVPREATVEDLKAQRSEATRRFIEKEISEDEWTAITFPIESKIRRLQAAEKKKAEEAEKKAAEAKNAPPPAEKNASEGASA